MRLFISNLTMTKQGSSVGGCMEGGESRTGWRRGGGGGGWRAGGAEGSEVGEAEGRWGEYACGD